MKRRLIRRFTVNPGSSPHRPAQDGNIAIQDGTGAEIHFDDLFKPLSRRLGKFMKLDAQQMLALVDDHPIGDKTAGLLADDDAQPAHLPERLADPAAAREEDAFDGNVDHDAIMLLLGNPYRPARMKWKARHTPAVQKQHVLTRKWS